MTTGAQIAVAVMTLSSSRGVGEERTPDSDIEYSRALLQLMAGLEPVERMAAVAALGDICTVLADVVAQVRGESREETIRQIALMIAQAKEP